MIPENVISKPDISNSKWNANDTTWMLCLFGTAIGAGVLFLPINAGLGGIIPLLIITVMAFPITYFSHRAFSRLILNSGVAERGISGAIREYFGDSASKLFNLIYFLSIYSILLMYSVAVTNTAESFITHQLGFASPNRAILSLLLILTLLFIVRFGQTLTLKIMSFLVYPFIASLIFMSVWLIPHWNTAMFDYVSLSQSNTSTLMVLWMIFPVLVLSFNHYPIVSPLVVSQQKLYGNKIADKKCGTIQRNSYILMVSVVLFFVYSCSFSLNPVKLAEAKAQNISILSYLANQFDTPLIAWMAPIIAFFAIMKSFLGHYIGTHETLSVMINSDVGLFKNTLSSKKTNNIIFVFMVLTCWAVAYTNPSILGIMEVFSGPIGALIALILPIYTISRVKKLEAFRDRISNKFVFVVGVITVSAILYSMFA